jgi:hypothetical protein
VDAARTDGPTVAREAGLDRATGTPDAARPDATTGDVPPAGAGTLTMTLDGTPMTATSASGMIANHLKSVTAVFGNPLTDPNVTVNFGLTPAVGMLDPEMGLKISFTRQSSVWACDRYVMGSTCSLTLTALGGPGEKVAGTFTGTLVKQSSDAAAMTVSITGGTFEFVR